MADQLILRSLSATDEAAFRYAFESWDHQTDNGYTSLYAFVGEAMVGMLTIRHELNEFLFRIGGHIGNGVVPPERKKGYATEMLRQALPVARALGIERALVTCDEPNIGSARTIERCGGIYENSSDQGPEKPRKRRFWIEISKP